MAILGARGWILPHWFVGVLSHSSIPVILFLHKNADPCENPLHQAAYVQIRTLFLVVVVPSARQWCAPQTQITAVLMAWRMDHAAQKRLSHASTAIPITAARPIQNMVCFMEKLLMRILIIHHTPIDQDLPAPRLTPFLVREALTAPTGNYPTMKVTVKLVP